MKMRVICSVILIATLGAFNSLADPYLNSRNSHLHGTGIFHWTVRKTLIPADLSQEALSGSVLATRKRQGNADKQALLLTIKGLQPNTTYQLHAVNKGTQEPILITDFVTSSRGAATLRSKKSASSKSLPKMPHKSQLPASLDPLTQVKELTVTDQNGIPILTAELSSPDRWQFLFKRELTNPADAVAEEAEGVLHLKSHPAAGWFRLSLAGLRPQTEYFLVKNGNPETKEAVVTDELGRLSTLTDLDNPHDMPDLESLSIWDDAGNVILTTDLLGP